MDRRVTGRAVGRVIGWACLMLTLIVVLRDAAAALQSGGVSPAPLGNIWYALSPGTLNGLQAGVERYISPALWDSAFFPLLQQPAFLFFLIPGVILVVLCRSKAQPKKRRMFNR